MAGPFIAQSFELGMGGKNSCRPDAKTWAFAFHTTASPTLVYATR